MSSKSRKRRRSNDDRNNQKHYALDTKINLEIKPIYPLTKNQELAFKSYPKKNMFLYGTAGTGKSFIASGLAFEEIFSQSSPYKKLVIVRSLVQTREMGHLPGKPAEKAQEYEAPYQAICAELFGRADAYSILKQKGFVSFISTSFIRGITLNDCIVLVDECQNMTAHELHSVITRAGSVCKFIFAGDLKQVDLNKRKEYSGLSDFMKIIKAMNCFEFIEFKEEDIVRGPLVKSYIITRNRLEDSGHIEHMLL